MLSKSRKYLQQLFSANGLLWSFVAVLVLWSMVGIGFSFLSWFVTWTKDSSRLPFCLRSDCVDHAKNIFEGSIALLSLTGQVTMLIATVGGILIALFSFFHTSRVSAFGNHVSHISIFSAYLSYEVSKRDRISPASVDIYGLYALMFSRSRGGSMELSNEYVDRFRDIVSVIDESNKMYKSTEGEKFNLRVHQAKLKKALAGIKIKCEITHHRVDFMEIEAQIFELIDSISVVFCADKRVERLPPRAYV